MSRKFSNSEPPNSSQTRKPYTPKVRNLVSAGVPGFRSGYCCILCVGVGVWRHRRWLRSPKRFTLAVLRNLDFWVCMSLCAARILFDCSIFGCLLLQSYELPYSRAVVAIFWLTRNIDSSLCPRRCPCLGVFC